MTPRQFFFHAHGPECEPVCVLDKVREAGWLVLTPKPKVTAAGGLRSALADVLTKWDQWYVLTPERERPNSVAFLAVKKAVTSASEVLAAAPPPLDVERLARAYLHAVANKWIDKSAEVLFDPSGRTPEDRWRAHAQDVAQMLAAYVRDGQEEGA